MEEHRETDSVLFSEKPESVHQYHTSCLTLGNNDMEVYECERGDNIDKLEYDESLDDGPLHHPFSRLIIRTCRERLGEYFVRVSCTAIVGLALLLCVVIAVMGAVKVVIAMVYWQSCPLAYGLPVFLLLSALVPACFYVTCRTRRKEHGKTSQAQRIMGRWQFSAFPCTLDTQRSWQAGLAAVLSLFLLCWLIYGTILVSLTSHRVKERVALCFQPVAELLTNGNSTAGQTPLSSFLGNASSWSLMNRNNIENTDMKTHSSPSLSSSSMSSLSLSPSSVSSTQNLMVLSSVNKPVPSSSFTSPSLYPLKNHTIAHVSAQNESAVIADDDSDFADVERGSDINAEGEGCVVGCSEGFLMWCWYLVLFDWLYLTAITINVMVVGFVPCCCYVGTDG